MRHLRLILIAATALPLSVHAAAPNMKEGLWETTVKMEMPGMPGGMPPQTMQRCYTKKDLEDPSKTTPSGQRDNRCKMTDYKLQGNTASWKVQCEGEGAASGTGSVTYAGNSYTGTQTIKMSHGGKPQTMTMHYTGKHLGNCK